MEKGRYIGHQTPLFGRASELSTNAEALFRTVGTEEEYKRMSALIAPYNLYEVDVQFFLERVIMRTTFRELAAKHGFTDASHAFKRYKKIRLYLKDVM